MDPWYKATRAREEVREGRSFNPDEFAIALEQVVLGTAPEDYSKPENFFHRTYFTRALRDHIGMVLRRLDGRTENTAPVLTLITQFGGGKTHTLTALYHLVKNSHAAAWYEGVPDLLRSTGLNAVPRAQVAVFVGQAWDPREGQETPWIDIARQLAGDAGVDALGPTALTAPPGTQAINELIKVAGGSVLVLFDEVLNLINRHREFAEPFHAFIQNLTVAMTGTSRSAAVISLPRSQVEMTDWDLQWQDRITKVVRRVAKDLIANDEGEISEVIRRRLFEEVGSERLRKRVAAAYADWCFAHRAELPPEWTAVDTAVTEASAREFLRARFEACYPFHPATLSVFQRKWQALPQYQQTRGTLAMLAQWVSCALRNGYRQARNEPLISLGSAPLEVREFLSVVLGQIGEQRLSAAIQADISGPLSHARALDADPNAKGPLKDIHRRVGTAILFESSGGHAEKVAHYPELRFALGEPEVDTTSIDNAANALEAKGFFIRRVGSVGFKIHHQATLKKVVSDRRAGLDWEAEVKPVMRRLVREEFSRGASIFADVVSDGAGVGETPKLQLYVLEPDIEWLEGGAIQQQVAEWTWRRGKDARQYPAALVWCLKKPGREFRNAVEQWLAWQQVKKDMDAGILGPDYTKADRDEADQTMKQAQGDARDEVWAGYRFVVVAEKQGPEHLNGLRVIDLGAGHTSGSDTLCGRIINALKTNALLNETVGAGYIERHWPPALKESGAWPLSGLRQSFLDGSLTRLLDPDAALRSKIVEFVGRGDFGLASGARPAGAYDRIWFDEPVPPEEVTFEAGVFLLTKEKATALKERSVRPSPHAPEPGPLPEPEPGPTPPWEQDPEAPRAHSPEPEPTPRAHTLRIRGSIPPESWNRFGTRMIPKLRNAADLTVGVEFTITVDSSLSAEMWAELRQAIEDLGLSASVRIEAGTDGDRP